LAFEMRLSAMWLYYTSFAETDCNTARKMRAAGVVPIVPAFAGLAESAAGESSQTQWIPKWDAAKSVEEQLPVAMEAIEKALAVTDAERLAMSQEAIETGSLEARLPLWNTLLG
jgi:hypothetical protein